MRITLKDFSLHIKYSSDKLVKAEEYFNRGNQAVFKSIQSKVYNLNLKLFKSLQDIKKKKLYVLMLPHPSPVQNLVICTPEGVDLPSDQCDVLARGLRLIPTPRGINLSDVNFELERFYRRVELHAFFNDQNRGFVNGSPDDDDDFSKFNSKSSNWMQSANPLCVDRFIGRCREEVSSIQFDKQYSKRSNILSTQRKALLCLTNEMIYSLSRQIRVALSWCDGRICMLKRLIASCQMRCSIIKNPETRRGRTLNLLKRPLSEKLKRTFPVLLKPGSLET